MRMRFQTVKAGDFRGRDMLADSMTLTEGFNVSGGEVSLPDVELNGDLLLVDTVWDDLVVPLTTTRQGSNSRPDFDFTNIGFLFPKNDATEILYFVIQLPHRWKAGSTIFPHVHWRQAENVTPIFKLDYKWHTIGGTVASEFLTYTMSTKKMAWTTGTIHQISDGVGGIAGTGKGISSMLVCKLYRDDNVGSGDVLVDQFDVHIEIDSLGSDLEYVK
jgi:hypothetical protein